MIITSKDYIIGGHYTNKEAYNMILKDGKIGITSEESINRIIRILTELKIPEDKIIHYITKNRSNIIWDCDSVSFFANMTKERWEVDKGKSPHSYSKFLADNWGESYGHNYISALKYAARVKKAPFKMLKEKYLSSYDKTPVCIICKIPIWDIPDLENILSSNDNYYAVEDYKGEIYTKGVLSTEYIIDVWE